MANTSQQNGSRKNGLTKRSRNNGSNNNGSRKNSHNNNGLTKRSNHNGSRKRSKHNFLTKVVQPDKLVIGNTYIVTHKILGPFKGKLMAVEDKPATRHTDKGHKYTFIDLTLANIRRTIDSDQIDSFISSTAGNSIANIFRLGTGPGSEISKYIGPTNHNLKRFKDEHAKREEEEMKKRVSRGSTYKYGSEDGHYSFGRSRF